MNIYQSNTYRKDLSWLHFDSKPGVQEKQLVKGQHYCISIFVAYPAIPSSNQEHQPRHDRSVPYMAIILWPYGRFIEIQSNLWIKKLHRTNHSSNFLGGSLTRYDANKGPDHLQICFKYENIGGKSNYMEEI